MFLGSVVCTVLLLWMVVKLWRRNALLAISSFLFWPVLVFAVLASWGDEKSDIRLPFALFLAAAGYVYYEMTKLSEALGQV
jgi:hypothetical protein